MSSDRSPPSAPRSGLTDLHVVVRYGRDRVQNHFSHAYRDRSLTSHHRDQRLGTPHAVLQATAADRLVVNGERLLCAAGDRDLVATLRERSPDGE